MSTVLRRATFLKAVPFTLPLMWGGGVQSGVILQKKSWILKPQTSPGETGWSPVWFAFGALIFRTLEVTQAGKEWEEGREPLWG